MIGGEPIKSVTVRDTAGTFGERLSNVLAERPISPKQLSDQLGVSESLVSKWRSGKSQPGVEMLDMICAALKVSPNYLLGWHDAEQETVCRLMSSDYTKPYLCRADVRDLASAIVMLRLSMEWGEPVLTGSEAVRRMSEDAGEMPHFEREGMSEDDVNRLISDEYDRRKAAAESVKGPRLDE